MSCKKNKGFTLTEVLVVVLIIGVIAAIAYPVYTKAINKSRAVEAINLIEIVKNKQIANFARSGEYLKDFSKMGQLTSNAAEERIGSEGASLNVGKYLLSINKDSSCIRASYIPAKGKDVMFTFSSSYERSGLGCDGDICSSFGNIVGSSASVCSCVDTCAAGYTLDPNTCSCACAMECSSGGVCKSKSQDNPTTQSCGNGGTQTRTCTPSCEGGSCGGWSACTGEAKECDEGTKPAQTEACGNCGTKTRTVSCDTKTGSWTSGGWGSCTGAGVCTPNATQNCGKGGTQTCSDTCAWGSCSGEAKECPQSNKPSDTQACDNGCGTLTRAVSCNESDGTWIANPWQGSCVCNCPSSKIWSEEENRCICKNGYYEYKGVCGVCGTSDLYEAWWDSDKGCCKGVYKDACDLAPSDFDPNALESCGDERCLSFRYRHNLSEYAECSATEPQGSSGGGKKSLISYSVTGPASYSCSSLPPGIDPHHIYNGVSDATLSGYCPATYSSSTFTMYFLNLNESYESYYPCVSGSTVTAKKLTCTYGGSSGGDNNIYTGGPVYLCRCAPPAKMSPAVCRDEFFSQR